MRLVSWLLRAFIFFTLFAFALNNQQPAVVHWFFGVQWRAPLVIVVLAAFAAGCVIGTLAMLPGWWRRRAAAPSPAAAAAAPPGTAPAPLPAGVPEPVPEHPPRVGL